MSGNPLPRNAALIAAVLVALPCPGVAQGSWAFTAGAYTHDPQTGVRVTQYAEPEPVEPLPDPRQTVSRYWRTRTNLRGADGSRDTIYTVRSFGNTLGGFDAQRERGYDASLQTLNALTPFRYNPYLFFGGLQGFGYGFPGYPAAVPGVPVPTPQGAPQPTPTPDCPTGDCGEAAPPAGPQAGQPGTAWPYAPAPGFVAAPFPYPYPYPYYGGFGYGGGYGPGRPVPYTSWGYGPGREGYVPLPPGSVRPGF